MESQSQSIGHTFDDDAAAPLRAILSFVEFALLFSVHFFNLVSSAHYVIARIECYAKCKRHTDPAERPSHNGCFFLSFCFFNVLKWVCVCVSVSAVHLGGSRHSCLFKHYVLNWCAEPCTLLNYGRMWKWQNVNSTKIVINPRSAIMKFREISIDERSELAYGADGQRTPLYIWHEQCKIGFSKLNCCSGNHWVATHRFINFYAQLLRRLWLFGQSIILSATLSCIFTTTPQCLVSLWLSLRQINVVKYPIACNQTETPKIELRQTQLRRR